MVSRGADELGDALLGAMARQLGVTRRQVYQMVGCSIDREGYIDLLSEDSEGS